MSSLAVFGTAQAGCGDIRPIKKVGVVKNVPVMEFFGERL